MCLGVLCGCGLLCGVFATFVFSMWSTYQVLIGLYNVSTGRIIDENPPLPE